MAPCSIHLFYAFQLFYGVFFSCLVFLRFCWLPICQILPESGSSFFPLFWSVPKVLLLLQIPSSRWERLKLLWSWLGRATNQDLASGYLACSSRGMGRRKAPEEKGEVLSLWASLTTAFVHGRVIAHSIDRQTSLREKNALVIYLPIHFQKFSATQGRVCKNRRRLIQWIYFVQMCRSNWTSWLQVFNFWLSLLS